MYLDRSRIIVTAPHLYDLSASVNSMLPPCLSCVLLRHAPRIRATADAPRPDNCRGALNKYHDLQDGKL